MLKNYTGNLRSLGRAYPRQFWLLMAGTLINTIGVGFVWPFLTIYLTDELGIALSLATMLPLMEQSVALVAALVAGSIADRYGRKGLMVVSLSSAAMVFALMGFAQAWWMFVILMGLRGLFLPLYRVAGDAMVADLITEEERRLPAYSLLRMANNVGVAIGPVLGGIVAAYSYKASFLTAAGAMAFFSILVAFGMSETLPRRAAVQPAQSDTSTPRPSKSSGLSYKVIFQDHLFMWAVLAFTFNGIAAGLMFQLIGVYGKQNFGITEDQTGLIMTINALMVILFQVKLSNISGRYHPLKMLALGAVFYGVGVGSVALGSTFYQFAASMVVMTVGELLVVPTFTSFVVNLAPEEMRGRYMSFYNLSWSLSVGLGPAIAGQMYERYSPASIWIMGGAFSLLAAALFGLLAPRFTKHHKPSRSPVPLPD